MKGLKNKIITTALDETGIRLHPRDFQIGTFEKTFVLKLWNKELIRKKFLSEKSLESDEFVEDLLTELFDAYANLRAIIIEAKKEELDRTFMSDTKQKVLAGLKKQKVSDASIKSLDFEFTEFSNTKSSKGATDDWGMPLIGLRITDYEGIEVFYPLDFSKEPLVLDMEQIIQEVIKKVR